ncbi:conserved hypothetical protein [Ricinus communis]|uniref:Uncharacterized protein n=1 Tax=Ricinus communis TaxID=3988 RepID=B9TQ49_RICCO|nr:conserved hypothetical protein [Ricinus communis]
MPTSTTTCPCWSAPGAIPRTGAPEPCCRQAVGGWPGVKPEMTNGPHCGPLLLGLQQACGLLALGVPHGHDQRRDEEEGLKLQRPASRAVQLHHLAGVHQRKGHDHVDRNHQRRRHHPQAHQQQQRRHHLTQIHRIGQPARRARGLHHALDAAYAVAQLRPAVKKQQDRERDAQQHHGCLGMVKVAPELHELPRCG